jgi:hypothetical protein
MHERGRSIGRLFCLALIAASVGLTLSAAVASGAAVLPPELVALEQHTSELKLTSLRFTLDESTTVPGGGHEIAKLLKLSGSDSTHGGLDELFTVNGHAAPIKKDATPQSSVPTLAEPPFGALEKDLAGAREVQAVGAGTVGGQPVTSFVAVLEPPQLEGEKPSTLKAAPTPALRPPTTTLEVSFAQSGLPVRTIIRAHDSQLTDTETLEIPEVNFPLVIAAPAEARTIGIRAFRRLERRSEAMERKRRKKK